MGRGKRKKEDEGKGEEGRGVGSREEGKGSDVVPSYSG